MSKKKLKKIRNKSFDVQLHSDMKSIRDYLTPFQDENSVTMQSWFHDLAEWYAKVLFPNLAETAEAVDLVRREIWSLDDSQPHDSHSIGHARRRKFIRKAVKLFRELEEEHAKLDESREAFERVRAISHSLSDSIEVIKGDLRWIAEHLGGIPTDA